MKSNIEKFGIKFVDVNGTPIEEQSKCPLIISNSDIKYQIGLLETKMGKLPVYVRVENGSNTALQIDLKDELLVMFTIPENGLFYGDIPFPCIADETDEYRLKFLLKDESLSCKNLISTIYKKS